MIDMHNTQEKEYRASAMTRGGPCVDGKRRGEEGERLYCAVASVGSSTTHYLGNSPSWEEAIIDISRSRIWNS